MNTSILPKFKIESERYTMQQLASRPQPDQQANRGGAPRSQVILIVALLFFSLAGLASGFSVGAMTGKTAKTSQGNTQITNIAPSVKGQITTPVPKSTAIRIIPLGCPQSTQNSSIYQGLSQLADGATSYMFVGQAVDQTGKDCTTQNKPIHATGITFKLWLTKHIPMNKIFGFPQDEEQKVFPHVDQLAQALNGKVDNKDFKELTDEIQFDANTRQIQQTNTQGQVTWHYKINPELKSGTYSLIILSNWQGKTYNWSWFDLVVKKQA